MILYSTCAQTLYPSPESFGYVRWLTRDPGAFEAPEVRMPGTETKQITVNSSTRVNG